MMTRASITVKMIDLPFCVTLVITYFNSGLLGITSNKWNE